MAEEHFTYSSTDLFSGIGGIRLGFQEAFDPEVGGYFSVDYACEINKRSQATYKHNFTRTEKIFEDITVVPVEDFGYTDICMAGFPCQTFSKAGKRQGFNDNRGVLYQNVVEICRHWKPMVIFCENVKELYTRDHGSALDRIVADLSMNGEYQVFKKVLNSKNFGVPQNRTRLYIVAFRKGILPEDQTFEFPSENGPEVHLDSIIEKGPVAEHYYLSTRYLNTLKRHKERQMERHNGFGYVVRDVEKGIAGTLVCGGMGKERNLLIDKKCEPKMDTTNREYIRAMTPTEWKRLQGFPESFTFPDSVAMTYQYFQLANSVTVSVIKAIAEAIKPILDNYLASGGVRNIVTGNQRVCTEVQTVRRYI